MVSGSKSEGKKREGKREHRAHKERDSSEGSPDLKKKIKTGKDGKVVEREEPVVTKSEKKKKSKEPPTGGVNGLESLLGIRDANVEVKKEEYPNRLKDYIKNKKTRKLLKARGIKFLFPVQEKTYNMVYEGKDLIARDRTGSGKTLGYALPLTERLRENNFFSNKKTGQNPYVLVILPTRELCIQVSNEFNSLRQDPKEFRVLSIYGGTEIRAQMIEIRAGGDILVGTPGRIIDMLERNVLHFEDIQTVVLDEADQMLNFGFQEDIEKIYEFVKKQKVQEEIQNILFSATVPSWIHEIARKYIKKDREYIDLIKNSEIKTAMTVEHLAINCPFSMRTDSIGDVVLVYGGRHSRAIIFTETKKEANDILLKAKIKQECQVLHGDIPQKQREITFQGFREGKFKCLIATNVAARGLDIPEVDLIIQLDPPKDVDTYIHRAGRTARAGRKGVCIIFYNNRQISLVERIEKRAKIKFKRVGAPQPQDIVKSSARDIAIGLKNVSSDVLPLFEETAKKLIEEIGPEEALKRCLAYMSGFTEKLKQRSLLCSIEGFITMIVRCKVEFRSLGYVWNFLRSNFKEDIVSKIKGMKSFKNKMGAAFDIPEDCFKDFEDYSKRDTRTTGMDIEKADTLPELEEDMGTQRSSGPVGGATQSFQPRSYSAINKQLEIFIGGLPFDTNENEIRAHFLRNDIGFDNFNLLKNADDPTKTRGIAFGQCKNEEALQRALKMDGSRFGNRSIRISLSSNKGKN